MIKNINYKRIRSGKFSLKKLLVSVSLMGAVAFTGCSGDIGEDSKNIFTDENMEIVSVEEYVAKDYYMIKNIDNENLSSYITKELDKKIDCYNFDTLCAPSDFGKYVGEENVTWNDIRNTINGMDIEDRFKQILINGVNNLEKNEFNMSLEVLNYNLKNLTVKYVDKTQDDINTGRCATFDQMNHEVRIYDTDVINFELLFTHEVLGHGMTMAFDEENRVYCDEGIMLGHINDKNKLDDINFMGKSYNECIAEIIRYYAMNEKINYDDTAYSPYVYAFILICKTCNISLVDFANNGVEYLMQEMKNSNLLNITGIIANLDYNLDTTLYQHVQSDTYIENYLEMFLAQYMQNEVDKSHNIELVTKKVNNMIDSYKTYMNVYVDSNGEKLLFVGDTAYDYVSIDQLKQLVTYFENTYYSYNYSDDNNKLVLK